MKAGFASCPELNGVGLRNEIHDEGWNPMRESLSEWLKKITRKREDLRDQKLRNAFATTHNGGNAEGQGEAHRLRCRCESIRKFLQSGDIPVKHVNTCTACRLYKMGSRAGKAVATS